MDTRLPRLNTFKVKEDMGKIRVEMMGEGFSVLKLSGLNRNVVSALSDLIVARSGNKALVHSLTQAISDEHSQIFANPGGRDLVIVFPAGSITDTVKNILLGRIFISPEQYA